VKILLSNDDGYRAEGIRHLAVALQPLAELTVVAPERNRSGAGHSLTLDVPLRVFQVEPNVYYVNGTPTDCVHLAISGLFDYEHDMVVSGINDGANLGDDVLYSGTVAAAIEGRFLGLPTIAVSLCTEPGSARHFETAGRIARELVAHLTRAPLHGSMILNVNVPAGVSSPVRADRACRRSEGKTDLLGRSSRTAAGSWTRHRLQCRGERIRVGHTAADRSDTACRRRRHSSMVAGHRWLTRASMASA
jgi:5'-nucleotidase